MSRRAIAVAAGAGVGLAVVAAAGSVVARAWSDEDRRARAERSWRVARLTTRRSVHFAVVKVRGVGRDAEVRARLDEQFSIRSAQDVAAELGQMKGVLMKLGQLASVVAEGLPEEAQQALATLQADVPPMAPSLAEQVVREELGADPRQVFLDWEPVPVAAASIGQVHRAVLHDGRVVAVKVQYPGIERAIRHDLDNAEALYAMLSAVALRGLDPKELVDELRERMGAELDYREEAANQTEMRALFEGHPFVRIPAVVEELSTGKVLTTEWADGQTWAQFEATASPAARATAAEVLFRFAQGCIHAHVPRYQCFPNQVGITQYGGGR